jgi:hypothetical protein
MINYDNFTDVMTAAEKVVLQLQVNKEQALAECEIQGFKQVNISESNKTVVAKFILRNVECGIRILKRKRGTYIRLNVPEEIIPKR